MLIEYRDYRDSTSLIRDSHMWGGGSGGSLKSILKKSLKKKRKIGQKYAKKKYIGKKMTNLIKILIYRLDC